MDSYDNDEGAVLIRIHLQDSYASSTTIQVTATTKASDVCRVIDQKLGIPEEDRLYDTLICVVSGFDGKTNQHWLKTLKNEDRILKFQQEMIEKRRALSKNSDILNSLTCNWYYKDIRSTPLHLDGETSGNSSSDSEDEMPLNDLIYLGSGDRRAVMYKRSNKDPNLWRRRLCVLTDKIWCINLKKKSPWVSCINLDGSASLQDDAPELKYPYGLIIRSSTGLTHFLRASSASEQHIWCEELQDRVAFGAENAVVHLAEMIICDEEAASVTRRNKVFMECMHTTEVREALSGLLPEVNVAWGGIIPVETESVSPRMRELSSDLSHSSSMKSLKGLLVREDYRRRDDFLHRFHKYNKACALGIALVAAIDNFKSAYRHDITVPVEEVWRLALAVYVEFVLPYVDSTSIEERSLLAYGGGVDRAAEISCGNESEMRGHDCCRCDLEEVHRTQKGETRPLSAEKITRLHEEIFQNIRKVGISKVPTIRSSGSGKENSSAASEASTGSYWFWPPAPPVVTEAAAAVSRAMSRERQDSASSAAPASCFVTCRGENYEILNMKTRPDSVLFDDISDSVIDELDNDD